MAAAAICSIPTRCSRCISAPSSSRPLSRAFTALTTAAPLVRQPRLPSRVCRDDRHAVLRHAQRWQQVSRSAASLTVAAFGARAAMTELMPKSAPSGQEIATFAGGCFWGLELAYQRQPGVTFTTVGYTQGHVEAPSYQTVCRGSTGHTEAVQVYYDPSETSYDQLLELFFERVDPTTRDRQGNDSGSQYRSGIYYHNDEQKAAAEKAIQAVNEKLKSNAWRRVIGSKVVTELQPAGDMWQAETHHRQYLQKGGQDSSKGATDRIRCYG